MMNKSCSVCGNMDLILLYAVEKSGWMCISCIVKLVASLRNKIKNLKSELFGKNIRIDNLEKDKRELHKLGLDGIEQSERMVQNNKTLIGRIKKLQEAMRE